MTHAHNHQKSLSLCDFIMVHKESHMKMHRPSRRLEIIEYNPGLFNWKSLLAISLEWIVKLLVSNRNQNSNWKGKNNKLYFSLKKKKSNYCVKKDRVEILRLWNVFLGVIPFPLRFFSNAHFVIILLDLLPTEMLVSAEEIS